MPSGCSIPFKPVYIDPVRDDLTGQTAAQIDYNNGLGQKAGCWK